MVEFCLVVQNVRILLAAAARLRCPTWLTDPRPRHAAEVEQRHAAAPVSLTMALDRQAGMRTMHELTIASLDLSRARAREASASGLARARRPVAQGRTAEALREDVLGLYSLWKARG